MEAKAAMLPYLTLEVYADGACSPNPGKGGTGYILRVNQPFMEITGSEGYYDTTNNRMEMLAALKGLEKAKEYLSTLASAKEYKKIRVISDSSYLCSGFTKKWIRNWQTNNWLTSEDRPVKNVDLWEEFLRLEKEFKDTYNIRLHFIHIPGHQGHFYNEKCDRLAREARQSDNLAHDFVYEGM